MHSIFLPIPLWRWQVYSRVDPRVRQLAYVVKYWARRRHINNASEGTLSSYAYILLILHFLQVRLTTHQSLA